MLKEKRKQKTSHEVSEEKADILDREVREGLTEIVIPSVKIRRK